MALASGSVDEATLALDVDVMKIRSILAFNSVGASLESGAIEALLNVHHDDDQRVEMVLLELEEVLGISLQAQEQMERWQHFSQAFLPCNINLSSPLVPGALVQNEVSKPTQEEIDLDIALDRETLLVRQKFPTLTYNEIFVFLRAHKDEQQRFQLAKDYFEHERQQLLDEFLSSPPSSFSLDIKPAGGFNLIRIKSEPCSPVKSPIAFGFVPVSVESDNLYAMAGPSGVDNQSGASKALDNSNRRQEAVLVRPSSSGEPRTETASSTADLMEVDLPPPHRNGNRNVVVVVSDDEDQDPTIEWDVRELKQILPDASYEELRHCLVVHSHQGDRVARVIDDLLDSGLAPQSAEAQGRRLSPKRPNAIVENPSESKRLKQEDPSEPIAREMHVTEMSQVALAGVKRRGVSTKAMVTGYEKEHRPASATSSKIAKRPQATATVEDTEVPEPANPDPNPMIGGVQAKVRPKTKRIANKALAPVSPQNNDTNPHAKNSKRAPGKGKALIKPRNDQPPPPVLAEDPNDSLNGEEASSEEHLTETKIARIKSLYSFIIRNIPSIHVLFAANHAVELVESGWNSERDASQTVVNDILISIFPRVFDEWLIPKSEDPPEKVNNVNSLRLALLNEVMEEQLANAIEMFPNLDPEYLEEKVMACNAREDLVQNVIMMILENSSECPTIEQYLKRQRCAEMAKKVWSVDDFLENYEDPIGHFHDPDRRKIPAGMEEKYMSQMVGYLRKEFPFSYERDIKAAIAKYGGQLVLVSHYLRNPSLAKRKLKRTKCELKGSGHITCPRLIEEINFLRVENEIKAIFDEKKACRLKAIQRARKKNKLLECAICCEDELVRLDFVTCPLGHKFCCDCVRKHVEEIMGMVKFHFPCLDPSCTEEFEPDVLKDVLKPHVFKRLMRRLQVEEIASANIDGLEMCPFCDFAAIPPEGDKTFKCLNPECSKESCRLCQEETHIPLNCQEFKTSEKLDKLRTYMEDKMTEALLRECPRCQKKFLKAEGCNKIQCPCGALSCYICRKEVKDYSHFDGQGVDTGKCPLWTNTEIMHQQEVQAQAIKTREELTQQNPGVTLDNILPKIPEAPTISQAQAQAQLMNVRLVIPALAQPAGQRAAPARVGGMGVQIANALRAQGLINFVIQEQDMRENRNIRENEVQVEQRLAELAQLRGVLQGGVELPGGGAINANVERPHVPAADVQRQLIMAAIRRHTLRQRERGGVVINLFNRPQVDPVADVPRQAHAQQPPPRAQPQWRH